MPKKLEISCHVFSFEVAGSLEAVKLAGDSAYNKLPAHFKKPGYAINIVVYLQMRAERPWIYNGII